MEIERTKAELTEIAEQYHEELDVLAGSLARLGALRDRFMGLHGGEVDPRSPAMSVLSWAESIIKGDCSLPAIMSGVSQSIVQVEHYRDDVL